MNNRNLKPKFPRGILFYVVMVLALFGVFQAFTGSLSQFGQVDEINSSEFMALASIVSRVTIRKKIVKKKPILLFLFLKAQILLRNLKLKS